MDLIDYLLFILGKLDILLLTSDIYLLFLELNDIQRSHEFFYFFKYAFEWIHYLTLLFNGVLNLMYFLLLTY